MHCTKACPVFRIFHDHTDPFLLLAFVDRVCRVGQTGAQSGGHVVCLACRAPSGREDRELWALAQTDARVMTDLACARSRQDWFVQAGRKGYRFKRGFLGASKRRALVERRPSESGRSHTASRVCATQ